MNHEPYISVLLHYVSKGNIGLLTLADSEQKLQRIAKVFWFSDQKRIGGEIPLFSFSIFTLMAIVNICCIFSNKSFVSRLDKRDKNHKKQRLCFINVPITF
jgi:hypothetical protein